MKDTQPDVHEQRVALSRRDFIHLAAAMGASLAWGGAARASQTKWKERRDLFPEGVASGDPDPTSFILWTRRPFERSDRSLLTVEVAEDAAFRRVVSQASAPVSAAADWTTRVLVGGLKPARRVLVSLHRPRGKWQPHRPNQDSASAQRFTARELRLRQLPECQ